MNDIIEDLRNRELCQQSLKQHWANHIDDYRASITAREAERRRAIQIGDLLKDTDLSAEESGWIGAEQNDAAHAIEIREKEIVWAEEYIAKCDDKIRVLNGLIAKLETQKPI